MKNPTISVDLDRRPTAHINIKANSVHDNGNGTFTIALPGRAITEEQHRVLEFLFPTTLEQAHQLLEKELLLSSLATHADMLAPAIRKY